MLTLKFTWHTRKAYTLTWHFCKLFKNAKSRGHNFRRLFAKLTSCTVLLCWSNSPETVRLAVCVCVCAFVCVHMCVCVCDLGLSTIQHHNDVPHPAWSALYPHTKVLSWTVTILCCSVVTFADGEAWDNSIVPANKGSWGDISSSALRTYVSYQGNGLYIGSKWWIVGTLWLRLCYTSASI